MHLCGLLDMIKKDGQRLKMNIVTGGDSKRGYDEGLSWGGNRLKFGERFSALGYKSREGLWFIKFNFNFPTIKPAAVYRGSPGRPVCQLKVRLISSGTGWKDQTQSDYSESWKIVRKTTASLLSFSLTGPQSWQCSAWTFVWEMKQYGQFSSTIITWLATSCSLHPGSHGPTASNSYLPGYLSGHPMLHLI